jgi:signal peptidase I
MKGCGSLRPGDAPVATTGDDVDDSSSKTAATPDLERPEPHQPSPRLPSRTRGIVEWVLVIAGAVIVALVIKTFLIQAFYIPSRSMEPTLEIDDRVLVNKLSYQLHDVNRGDIVVFERPESERGSDIKDLIKRVIALPGEQVVIRDDAVFIDGQRLVEPYLAPGTTIANGPAEPWRCTEDQPCAVPEGSVWVMGDNRTDSRDSRYFGPIPEDDIVGRAFVRIWPLDRAAFFSFPAGPWILVGGAVIAVVVLVTFFVPRRRTA